MSSEKPKIVIIAGPTASGKSTVGIALAEKFGGEIVSADSVQIYRFMDVGSAKPSTRERTRTPHHLIDIRDPDEDFTAGDYVKEAREAVTGILQRGRVPFVVGGTGLYIRLLLGGIVELPPADLETRQRLLREEQDAGPGTLYQRLASIDPETASRTTPQNLLRILRGLEVFEATGKSISWFQKKHFFKDRPYSALFICLNPPRPILYERIDKRVDCMIKGGLCDEVSQLYARGYTRKLKPLQSLGYRHACQILAGETNLDEAIRLMKRDTRRYAKRQLTWFRSEPGVLWFDPEQIEGIGFVVAHFLGG